MKLSINKATSHILFVILIYIFDIFKDSLDGHYGHILFDLFLLAIWFFNYTVTNKSIALYGLDEYIKNHTTFLKSICLFLLILNSIGYIEGTLSFLCPVIILMAVVTAYELVTIIFSEKIERIKRWLIK